MTRMRTLPAVPADVQGRSGDEQCPACHHAHGTESLSRGFWIWPFRTPILVRCCHTEFQQDSLVDLEFVCDCHDAWHLETSANDKDAPGSATRG